jgi:two-component system, NarL family, nitrate/nitrite response regulator NarL
VANILIYSNKPHLTAQWTHALIGDYNVSMLPNVHGQFNADLVLFDAKKLDEDASLLSIFANQHARFLVIGSNWPEQKQIEVLMRGAAGYCDESEPMELLKKAVESILKGDIWIRRSLVPKVIGMLISARQFHGTTAKTTDIEEMLNMLDSLSAREREVAAMIRKGENNKRIALVMNISERTVKAHLSSIFRKLDVSDRLHLAILLKEMDQYRKVMP